MTDLRDRIIGVLTEAKDLLSAKDIAYQIGLEPIHKMPILTNIGRQLAYLERRGQAIWVREKGTGVKLWQWHPEKREQEQRDKDAVARFQARIASDIILEILGSPQSNFMGVAEKAYQWKAKNKTLTCPISVTIELFFDKPRIANIVGIESKILLILRGVVFDKETRIHKIEVVRAIGAKPCTIVTIRKAK